MGGTAAESLRGSWERVCELPPSWCADTLRDTDIVIIVTKITTEAKSVPPEPIKTCSAQFPYIKWCYLGIHIFAYILLYT